MRRTFAALLTSSLLLSGCESSDRPFTQQEVTCMAWAGFASHQYARYLDGDLQLGELTAWASAHVVSPENQEHIIAVDHILPLMYEKAPADIGIVGIATATEKTCMKQEWNPLDSRTK